MQIEPGTRVLVTGASRGIGAAVARAFAARSCTLGLVARNAAELEQLARSLPGEGHLALPADVGDAAAVASAIERFGDADVLVANAGITHYMPFHELSLEQADQMTRVNWLGTVYSVKAVLGPMLARRRGHIVVVSSGAGLRSFPHAAVYGATKAAQRGFAEALRHELHDSGVSLTLVYPGEVETGLHDHELERMPEWYRLDRRSPAGPLAVQLVEAVERDKRELFYPPNVRLLRVAHGIAPALADLMLRRILGRGAAPRRR